jgi:RNA ligase (TIGR02306 family)
MNDNLATIQRVKNVHFCPDSDNLDLIQILGWQVVVRRNEFRENDLVVYIAIDTVLPERPEFEFLRNKHFRIKPIRLRKQGSAGIVFPLSILPKSVWDGLSFPKEGEDVSDVLSIIHYEKPIPAELAGIAKGGLPGYIIMTDELNLRTYPDALPELHSRPYYITRKDDGSSGTFFIKGGEFGVCSRKIQLERSDTNGYWKMAYKYDLENIIRKAFPDRDIAVQAEIVGPGIQKNKLGLKELELHLFNIFEIVNRHYMGYEQLVNFTKEFNIPMVTLIDEGLMFHYSLDELIKLANEQKYPTGGPAEGIVIRPKESITSAVLKRAWSGKVISENYKEKE